MLATDPLLAQHLSQRLNRYRNFQETHIVGENTADSTITFGAMVSLNAFPALPEQFSPFALGSFICWGADIALLVVDSSAGIDAESIARAQEVAQHHPLMVAITGLDAPRANFDETLAVISRVMDQGHHAVAITLPVLAESVDGEEPLVNAILDLVDLEIRIQDEQGTTTTHELESGHYDLIESHLEALTNAVVVTSTDDTLTRSVLAHGFDSADQLREELLTAAARSEIIPVFAIEGPIGISELAQFATELDSHSWTPTQSDTSELIATALTNNSVRVWQGELTLGAYYAHETQIEIQQITGSRGEQQHTAVQGEVVVVKTRTELVPGSLIQRAKSNPLAIDHVFE